jgi:hypothetical protein
MFHSIYVKQERNSKDASEVVTENGCDKYGSSHTFLQLHCQTDEQSSVRRVITGSYLDIIRFLHPSSNANCETRQMLQ